MGRNQGPEDRLFSVIAMCGRALESVTLPESSAGQIEAWRRLEELSSALASVKTRLEVVALGARPSGVPPQSGIRKSISSADPPIRVAAVPAACLRSGGMRMRRS